MNNSLRIVIKQVISVLLLCKLDPPYNQYPIQEQTLLNIDCYLEYIARLPTFLKTTLLNISLTEKYPSVEINGLSN